MTAKGGARVLVIVGATASGKTAAAIQAANEFGGEVINADSRLFYRGMDIGTAKPSQDDLSTVPHHLISDLDPSESFSLAQFLRLARELIVDISSRGKIAVVAGGTGQYVWGLLEGWNVPEVAPDLELRSELEIQLEAEGVESLFRRLEKVDEKAASVIDRQNHRRVIRAIERAASGAAGENRSSSDPGYDSLIIGLQVERPELHKRIEKRVDSMLAAGWVDEVRRLIASGINVEAPAMSAIGYREIAAHLRGEMTIAEARRRTIVATNRLVRHQNNWFKPTDERIRWADVTGGSADPVNSIVEKWLAK